MRPLNLWPQRHRDTLENFQSVAVHSCGRVCDEKDVGLHKHCV